MMNKKQMNFLQALLTETTVVKAAEKAGISRSTAYRYMSDSEFCEELKKAKSECLNSTIRFLQGNLTLCGEKLVEIVKNPDVSSQIKINAISCIFQNFKSLLDSVEIEDRMREIEKLLHEKGEQWE